MPKTPEATLGVIEDALTRYSNQRRQGFRDFGKSTPIE